MENLKRSKSKGKRFMSVLLAALLIGTTVVTAGSYTGTSITANAKVVWENEDYEKSGDFEYSTNNDGTVTIEVYNGNNSKVNIPSKINGKTVTSIGSDAFYGCTSLKEAIIPNSVTSIGSEVFFGCTSLTKVTIGNSVTSIGDYVFSACDSLKSIDIPASVTDIGKFAPFAWGYSGFYSSERFSNEGDYIKPFYGEINVDKNNKKYSSTDGALLSKDQSILIWSGLGIIPKTVKVIGKCSLGGNDGKDNITVPSNVEKIEEMAFFNYNLRSLKTINISSGVKEIETGAFVLDSESNPKVANVNVDKNNRNYSSKNGILYNKDGTKLIFCSTHKEVTSSVLDNVKEIGDFAFEAHSCASDDCIFKNSVFTIPDSVEIIGQYAFCRAVDSDALKIGKNVRIIGNRAFWGEHIFKEVNFPENLDFIGLGAFESPFHDGTKKTTTFKGYTGSYAELYCKSYGYKFESLGTVAEKPELANSEFGIKVKGSFPDGSTLSVEKAISKLIPNAVFCYNIALNKDSKTVQPTGFVTVSIPCDTKNCRVFYEDDEAGTLEDMNAIYLDGCYVFSTNHFSDYVIVPNDTEISATIVQPSFEITDSPVTPEPTKNNNSNNNNNNNNNATADQNNGTKSQNDIPPTSDSRLPVVMTAIITLLSGITAFCVSKTRRKKN